MVFSSKKILMETLIHLVLFGETKKNIGLKILEVCNLSVYTLGKTTNRNKQKRENVYANESLAS